MIAALVAGALAGGVHAVSGPDHLAAVVPLAFGRRRAWLTGLRWGLGHATGVAAVGLLGVLLREALPLERLASWGERLVGVALIVIGLQAMRFALASRRRIHLHEHVHGGVRHVHVHFHSEPMDHEAPQAHAHAHAAFGLGALHGLAGSSHLFGVLPVLTLPTRAAVAGYLCGYGLASIAAMVVLAGVVGGTSAAIRSRGVAIHQHVLAALGAAAVAVGAAWIVH